MGSIQMWISIDASSRKTVTVKVGLYAVPLTIVEDGGVYACGSTILIILITIPQASPHPVLNTTDNEFFDIPLNFNNCNREES